MLLRAALVVLVLVGTEAFFTWLSIANLRHGRRRLAERADWVRERFGVDEPMELADYQRARAGIGALDSWGLLGVLVLVLVSGLLGDAVVALQGTGLGPLAQGAVFFAGVAVAGSLLGLPFDAVETFVVEELFGFNEQGPRLFVRDATLKLVIGAVLAAALGAALLWAVATFPRWWAAVGAVLFAAFVLVMQVGYPRVIAPLFYDFVPIESGELREAVDDVFERAGFECEQVYEMDASRRSGHSNAYFVGFGRTKRVVLFDTLIEQMTIGEMQAVLAHELAHWKRAHVWKLIGASTLQVGLLLGVAQLLLDGGWLAGLFGLPAGATYAELFLALLVVGPLGRWLAPVSNRVSLAFEREADDIAVAVTDVPSMVDALSTLVSENLSNPFVHPLYETFHASHPPIPERIRRLEERGSPDADRSEDATAL
ncbi:MAG: M48 family metallopeptidase [Halobacteriales archaeon]|nr:M48 family metallopeptidase [Halobacteriales archaeon]